MEGEGQRVVLAHDASRGVQVNSIRRVPDKFMLKEGDTFTFLSIVHQIQHPMGYMMRVDSSMFGVNQKAIDDELANKKKEYQANIELVQISDLYKMQKVDFKIELVAGPILKNAAVEASKKIDATWVILDRRMKRDKEYFLEKLLCGISKLKRNDNIINIRGPKLSTIYPTMPLLPVDNKLLLVREAHRDEDLFSIELESLCTSSTSTRTSISEGMLTLGNNQDSKMELLMLTETYVEVQENSSSNHAGALPILKEKVQLDQHKCSTCNSTRPAGAWQTRNFSYLELVDATNRFSSENLIYRGENEIVFCGILKDSKLNVMVKVQKDVKKYKSEMQALEKLRHENVIMLLGTCLEEATRLLVFEYACNGSLHQHLSHQNFRPLTWSERIKIAIGASRGLYHLHENNIIHGDMRPKNILLTHDFEPLVAGFGLASLKNKSQDSSKHCIIGTLGYLAPEYTEGGKGTNKTDVYAFGMILLQLLTGVSPTDKRLQGKSLIKWVVSLEKEKKFMEMVDPRISYDMNHVVNVLQLALKCVCKDPHIRISMEEVLSILDEKTSYKGKSSISKSQHEYCDQEEKLLFIYGGGMTPVPKQAKHFYQYTHIS